MNELTDEDIVVLKHRDFKNKIHEKDCTCGYCELKRISKKKTKYDKL